VNPKLRQEIIEDLRSAKNPIYLRSDIDFLIEEIDRLKSMLNQQAILKVVPIEGEDGFYE
jgi:hypothetical protein